MSELLGDFVGNEVACSYLPDLQSRTHYRLIDRCDPQLYRHLLERGWRRFGRTFFRPVCESCQECRSLRVDIDRFRPNRSMRRVRTRNRDLEIALQPASASSEHLELYRRYHRDMAKRRGWPDPGVDLDQYTSTFAARDDTEFAHELMFRLEGRLVCVALLDLLPAALSAVYCYYEPELRSRSLGVFSVLSEIEIGRQRNYSFAYLGFRVEGNSSMRYKARYAPHQILDGRPDLDESPRWDNPSSSPP